MVSTTLLREAEALPTGDQLDLPGWLWDCVASEPSGRELAEAELGVALHRADPTGAVDWDLAMGELRQKFA